ncbi:MAG: hypothetical protein Q8P22_02380 [Chloroflexota bacterium]|nr:hypothetical protein [Chloroflexota bacterium]
MIDRNLEQHGRFMLYALEHPEILERIPDGAELFFLPDDDPQLCEANRKAGKEKEGKGTPVVYVKISVKPEIRTVLVPHIQLAEVVP